MSALPEDSEALEALFASLAPPATPADALARDPALGGAVAGFDLLPLVQLLAGIQTDPAFQANSIRFEWATRLALACARGSRAPARDTVQRLLNRRLEAAGIVLLEDPIEDVMVEPVCTPRGEYLLLTGTWEKAGHYTETVAAGFWMLPQGEPKQEALDQVFALLGLSDALVRRAGIARYTLGGGNPKAAIRLPPTRTLDTLSERVVFTWEDLVDAGIDAGLLAPFILHPDGFADLLDAEPGDSLLEFHPLILAEEGIVIAAPANLSTAVRARLLDAAISGGMGDRLSRNILAAQAALVEQGGLVPARGPLASFGGGFSRAHIETVSLGRYVHVLHAIEGFGDFPRQAFAFARDGNPAYAAAIADAVVAAHEHAAAQADFRQGVSLVFLAGWGSGMALEFALPPLPNWQIIVMSPHDGFVLGGCDDAGLKDLIWMDRQYRQVRAQGFDFADINGFLNRFQLWRTTDQNFVPEHWTDCSPPTRIAFDSDLLLAARREAHLAWDRRVLRRPGGMPATVMRMHPKTLFDELQPLYASYTAAQLGRFASAILVGDRLPIWFELDQPGIAGLDDAYETFKAMLEWAVRVLPVELAPLIAAEPAALDIRLTVELPGSVVEVRRRADDAEIAASIRIALEPGERRARITLAPAWQIGLQRADNQAEAALAGAVVDAARALLGAPALAGSASRARAILGGPDARWRHAYEVRRVVEMLKARDLLPRFEPIPASVSALVRTGLGWATRDRSAGPVIDGKAECRAFLDAQSAMLLASLGVGVRRFRRDALVRAALGALQAAQADERHWDISARALRAIHGAGSDQRVSLERRHQINVVLRTSTLVVELAMAECPVDTGSEVGPMDLAELQAHALLCFETGDLIPAIEGERIAPRLTISPTGLVGRDTAFEESTVHRSVRVVHVAQRDRAVRNYDQRLADAGDEDPAAPVPGLDAAVRAEYHVPLDRFLGLAQDVGDLGWQRREGVLQLRRSELIAALAAEGDDDIATLIDRLTLHPRAGWAVVPPGASPRDFDVAKLDRRFSPIGRPILALDAGDDPMLMVAPGLVERCILHNLQGALTGTLQNEFWTSPAMRSFTGKCGSLEGNRFNETVAGRLCELGLNAHAAVKPSACFGHKKTTEVEELGDFDVLAFTPDGSRVWVIEAKDLKLCRTIGESARRLSDYAGRTLPNGKPDKMLRHLRRVAYARRHVSDLARQLKLDKVPVVAGLLVVRAPQPMEAMLFGADADASVVMLSDLEQVPWTSGW